MKITHKNNRTKKIILCTLSLLVVTLVASLSYKLLQRDSLSDSPVRQPSSRPLEINDVDYSGLTDTEANSSQDAKRSGSRDNPQQDNTGNIKKNVSVAISYADSSSDRLEIRAFVTDVIEGSGQCSASVTRSDATLTAQSQAFIDASTTICEPMYIDKNQLTPGSWDVVVGFSSPGATGVSGSVAVEVN